MKEREKIRYRLSVNHLSFAWLIDMLRKRGIETNGPVLSAILAGTRMIIAFPMNSSGKA